MSKKEDPEEFRNAWHERTYREVRYELTETMLHAVATARDPGPLRLADA